MSDEIGILTPERVVRILLSLLFVCSLAILSIRFIAKRYGVDRLGKLVRTQKGHSDRPTPTSFESRESSALAVADRIALDGESELIVVQISKDQKILLLHGRGSSTVLGEYDSEGKLTVSLPSAIAHLPDPDSKLAPVMQLVPKIGGRR